MNDKSRRKVVSWSDAGNMSSFTSWGAGASLELKPEITAPGGNIWSTIVDQTYQGGAGVYNDYTGSYGMMSGTSMAAPHMSGLAAIVCQYVDANMVSLESKHDNAAIASKLLVSTKLNTYASQAVDPQIKQIFTKSAQDALNTKQKLMSFLNI